MKKLKCASNDYSARAHEGMAVIVVMCDYGSQRRIICLVPRPLSFVRGTGGPGNETTQTLQYSPT